MGVGAAELLSGDHLAGGRLHQRRSAQEDGPLPAHDDGLIRHGRHIGAAGGARAHDAGDLGDAFGAHPRLVEEDPAEVVAVGEHLCLMRQVGAAGVDQIDARKPVLLGDLLRPKVLLHGQGKIGAALHGGVVGHDHHLAPGDAAHARDQPGPGGLAAVETERGQCGHLEERRTGVQQPLHPLSRQELAAARMTLARALRSAQRHLLRAGAQLLRQRPVVQGVGLEARRARIGGGLEFRHGADGRAGGDQAKACGGTLAATPAQG